jgi:hypothetical protein
LTFLADKSSRFAEKVTNNTSISAAEQVMIISPVSVFKMYRSGVSFVNLFLTSDYDSSITLTPYFFPIYVLDKRFSIINTVAKTQGQFIASDTSLDWDMINSTLSFQRNYGGIIIRTLCNEINMSVETTIYWKNSKITYDGGKIPETMIETEMIWIS